MQMVYTNDKSGGVFLAETREESMSQQATPERIFGIGLLGVSEAVGFMNFHEIMRIPNHPPRADKSALCAINRPLLMVGLFRESALTPAECHGRDFRGTDQ